MCGILGWIGTGATREVNSLEVRAPFLDANLVEFAFTKVPSVWKCDGQDTQRIERLLARKWLPPALDIDRKQGFSVPLDAWFRRAGPEAIRERLAYLPDAIDRRWSRRRSRAS